MIVILGARTADLKIAVVGESSTGKTTFCNKANAMLKGLKERIHLREIHDVFSIVSPDDLRDVDDADGIIIIGSVKNLHKVNDTYAQLNSTYHHKCILVFITHTDQATQEEIVDIESLHVHVGRLFYAPVCDPFSADSINDSDFTLLLCIQMVSDSVEYAYLPRSKMELSCKFEEAMIKDNPST